ncbi:MAG: crotonase, partial [Leptospiraceae bacterium]|nr:crotonase [Leptospiraceae bacterium]
VLSGEMYSAEDAYQMGIANALVSPEALMETCEKYAASILKRGPIATREAKNVINRGLDLSMEEGLYQEKVSFAALFQKEEAKEGLSAFLEKRAPNF